MAEREVAAWRRFFAWRQLLCGNNVALKYRLRLLTSCVVSSTCWCAGSWILTRTQCAHLRAVQDRMLRWIIHVPRLPDDSAETHMTRWARALRNCKAKHKLPHGDEIFFASYFSWCGHIARMTRDPNRETSNLFLHRKYDVASELEEGTVLATSRTSLQSLEVGAGRVVKVAQNSTVWRNKLEEMINRKNTKWWIARVFKSHYLESCKDWVSEPRMRWMCGKKACLLVGGGYALLWLQTGTTSACERRRHGTLLVAAEK